MSDDDIEKIIALLHAPQQQKKDPVYKLYYTSSGTPVTYTVEDLPGTHIQISKEQYLEARMDVIVVDGEIIYTHTRSHTTKLVKNLTGGAKTSKYDVNILTSSDFVYWKNEQFKIK